VLELREDHFIEPATVPVHVREELDGVRQYYDYKNRCVFCDLVQQQLAEREGVVEESAQFLGEVRL
jgi:UDPglucose--hexose-1-phosphate uridylyltransferase